MLVGVGGGRGGGERRDAQGAAKKGGLWRGPEGPGRQIARVEGRRAALRRKTLTWAGGSSLCNCSFERGARITRAWEGDTGGGKGGGGISRMGGGALTERQGNQQP